MKSDSCGQRHVSPYRLTTCIHCRKWGHLAWGHGVFSSWVNKKAREIQLMIYSVHR